jgi:hypothetical protein
MGNPSSRPKYGPGNTVVGEPLFLPDDAFPSADMGLPYAPQLTPAPEAGASPIAPTAAAEATTGESHGFGYGYQANVSTPYPSAPATLAPYPSMSVAADPLRGPSAYGPHAHGPVPPPPAPFVTRPRIESSGPSLLMIGILSFVVIGGLTTVGFLMARSSSSSDEIDKPIIASAAVTGEAPAAVVPAEDPNSAAGSIPTDAPPVATARPVVTRRPGYQGPSNGRGRVKEPPRVRSSVAPPATAAPQVAPHPPDPPLPPAATQPNPNDPSPASSGRHRRGN